MSLVVRLAAFVPVVLLILQFVNLEFGTSSIGLQGNSPVSITALERNCIAERSKRNLDRVVDTQVFIRWAVHTQAVGRLFMDLAALVVQGQDKRPDIVAEVGRCSGDRQWAVVLEILESGTVVGSEILEFGIVVGWKKKEIGECFLCSKPGRCWVCCRPS